MKSDELKWLSNGSELHKTPEDSNTSSKVETYASFTRSQDSLLEFSSNPITVYPDIIVAKLGPGQVKVFHVFVYSN